MNHSLFFKAPVTRCLLLFHLILFPFSSFAQSDIWVTAYYAGWSQGWFNNGVLPAEAIDYDAVTHIIHFALWPRADGSLDSDANSIRPSNSAALIARAHAAGKKVLISVGGWASDVNFRQATSLLTLPTFVDNLVNFMTSRGYDGIDIDWERLELSDIPQYTLFIKELRSRLNQISPRPLLTAAVIWQPAVFATLANDFDQINIMTYDISGAWPGWVVWHNAPVSTQGLRFPSNGRLIPSAETMIDDFLAAGVPAKKLGIGIDFYGYIWSGGSGTPTGGVTAPGQTWTSAPRIQVNVPYYSLIPQYYRPEYYRWDSVAQAAYLSIDRPGSADDKFISYDNEISCARKIAYARSRGIGGVFIWELGGGQLPAQFPNRDRLLQAVKIAAQQLTIPVTNPSLEFPPTNGVGFGLSPALSWSPSASATFYRLQVATDETFRSVVLDRDWILWNTYSVSGLATNRQYYWRVLPSNISSEGSWSSPATFKTIAHTSLPESWWYTEATGISATVKIPTAAIPKIGTRLLKSGDGIGVFYKEHNALRCAGYGVWDENLGLTFTIWGDDAATPLKEGLSSSDSLQFQVWDAQTQREYPARIQLLSGDAFFRQGAVYELSSLTALPLLSQTIVLARGENMISAYVRPVDSTVSSLLATIRPRMLALRNHRGQSFMPDSNINTIGYWNFRHGYLLHMKAADTLRIFGEELTQEQAVVPLEQGWNLLPYLSFRSISPDSLFADISQTLIIAKNIAGQVYWPDRGLNTLGPMQPGYAYQVYVKSPTVLRYPATRVSERWVADGNGLSVESSRRSETTPAGPVHEPNSGFNAILLLEAPGLQDGDEVRVRTSTMLVGSGVVSRGKVLVTVWGDNALTAAVEGARENENLLTYVWSSTTRQEEPLIFSSVSDGLSGAPASSELRYKTDAVWVAHMQPLPTTFVLEQNYPNPFNPSTTIRYALPARSKVTLDLFDLLGRRVAVLVDQEQPAGYYSVVFRNPSLPSGIYIYRLHGEAQAVLPSAGGTRITFRQVRKMVIVR